MMAKCDQYFKNCPANVQINTGIGAGNQVRVLYECCCPLGDKRIDRGPGDNSKTDVPHEVTYISRQRLQTKRQSDQAS